MSAIKTYLTDDGVDATIDDYREQLNDADIEFNQDDYEAIKTLQVGESAAIGFSTITRIK